MVNDSIDDDKESLLRCWSVWHGRDDKILKNYHGDDITKWLGITVESVGDDQLERVTKIDWSRKGLEGPIPATLGELTELRELNLYDNRLEKEVRGSGELSDNPIPPTISLTTFHSLFRSSLLAPLFVSLIGRYPQPLITLTISPTLTWGETER